MGKNLAEISHCILCCDGGTCKRKGADAVTRELRAQLRMEGLEHHIHTIKTRCMGQCNEGPYVCFLPEYTWYKEMSVEKARELIDRHIREGNTLDDCNILFRDGMQAMNTDVPHREPKPKEWAEVEDEELGPIVTGKADPWEKIMHPLLKSIFEKYPGCELHLPQASHPLVIKHPLTVDFDGFYATISPESEELNLIIGPAPKDADDAVKSERIGTIDIFKTLAEPNRFGVRLRTKAGETKLIAYDRSDDLKLWRHLVQIYLETDPEEVLVAENLK